jgi:four helix bundle protein
MLPHACKGCAPAVAVAALSAMATHEWLVAWRLCHELALAVYAASDRWPKAEQFGLTSQARRAAHSAGANIAEGWARLGRPELCRYLKITLGSLGELSYTLRLARDRNLLTEADWADLEDRRGKAGAMVWRLYRAVRVRQGTRPDR